MISLKTIGMVKLAGLFAVVAVPFLLAAYLVIGDRARSTERIDQAQGAARINAESLKLCKLTNENNAVDAVLQRARADAAWANLQRQIEESDERIEEIQREAEHFAITQLACPALTPDFRRWVQGE